MLKKLIVAFDVNKTIIVEDKAGGKTQEDCLNNLLAWICYGKVVDGKWIWNSQKPDPKYKVI